MKNKAESVCSVMKRRLVAAHIHINQSKTAVETVIAAR